MSGLFECAPGVETREFEVRLWYNLISLLMLFAPSLVLAALTCFMCIYKKTCDCYDGNNGGGCVVLFATVVGLPMIIGHLVLLFVRGFDFLATGAVVETDVFSMVLEHCSREAVDVIQSIATVYDVSTSCEYSECMCLPTDVDKAELQNCSLTNPVGTRDFVCLLPGDEDDCCDRQSLESFEYCETYGRSMCAVDCTTTNKIYVVWWSEFGEGDKTESCNGVECAGSIVDRWTFENKTCYVDRHNDIYFSRTALEGSRYTAAYFFGVMWVLSAVTALGGSIASCMAVCSSSVKCAETSKRGLDDGGPPIRAIPPPSAQIAL